MGLQSGLWGPSRETISNSNSLFLSVDMAKLPTLFTKDMQAL